MEKHVLIIEDTRVFSAAVVSGLRDAGIYSVVVENIHEAVRHVFDHGERITGIVLDGNVPELSGPPVSTVPLIRRLKKMLPDVPLIAYSADPIRVREMLLAGCDQGVDKMQDDAIGRIVALFCPE